MFVEFELKYSTIEDTLKQLEHLFPGGTVTAMKTTYFDTPEEDIAHRMWTLRHRSEGGRHVCTLKVPDEDGVSRKEYECYSESIQDAIPILAARSGQFRLTEYAAKGLVPVCGAHFIRMAIPITQGQSTAELALDNGVLIGGGKQQPLYEVEVEFKSGSRDEIIEFAQNLARIYRLNPQPLSKFARAKALAEEASHGI